MKRNFVTASEIQRMDRFAIERLRISSLVLMENAGRSVAQKVLQTLSGVKDPQVIIFCGTGNNGGDGFVTARYLFNKNINVKVFLIGNVSRLKPDARKNYMILKGLQCAVHKLSRINKNISSEIFHADCVVDAIFGVGLNRSVDKTFENIISAMNAYAKKIISVDIPSGLDATTGENHKACVEADMTVTFTFPKKGFLLGDGPSHVGRVVVADIGVPQELIHSV